MVNDNLSWRFIFLFIFSSLTQELRFSMLYFVYHNAFGRYQNSK
jgi:hypothetical protein